MFALPPASAVVPGDDCVVAALPEIAGNPEGPEPLGVAGADDLRCLLQIVVHHPSGHNGFETTAAWWKPALSWHPPSPESAAAVPGGS